MNFDPEMIASLTGLFPTWPPKVDAVLYVSLAIVLAASLGELVFRLLRMPRVVGYAVTGTVISVFGAGIAGTTLNSSLRLIVDLALALLLFELGCRINLRWLWRNPSLLVLSLVESGLSFLAVFLSLALFGVETKIALAAGAVAMATSPALVMRVASELNASGQVTERLVLLSGLGTLYSVLTFKFILAWLNLDRGDPLGTAFTYPIVSFGGAIVVAALLAMLVLPLARKLDLRDENPTLLLIGLILLALAVSRMLNLSTLAVPLLAGLILRNTTARPWVWPQHFGTAGGVLVLLLFVTTGSVWSIQAIVGGLFFGVVLIAARQAAKMASALLLGPASGISRRQSLALGIGMTPLSACAIVLLSDLQSQHPHFASMLTLLVFAAIGVLELAGPVATHYALRMAREADPPPSATAAAVAVAAAASASRSGDPR